MASFWGRIGGDVTSSAPPPPMNNLEVGGRSAAYDLTSASLHWGASPVVTYPWLGGRVQEVPVSC